MPRTASRARPDRGRVAVAAIGVMLAVGAVAGCADTQPGDKNPGAGYTNQISDLLVKIPALSADPCRSSQADRLFANCGRYVTEIAGTVAALRADLPSQATATNALQNAVNTYQGLRCDSAGTSPSAQQREQCPKALTAIGAELDKLGRQLLSTPTTP